MLASNNGSWDFEGRKRRKEVYFKMSEHGHRMINRMLKREGLNWRKWQIHRRGLESNWAVEEKVKQYYEIVRLE